MWTLERRKRASTIVTKSSSEDETSDGSEEKKALCESDIKEVKKKAVSESNDENGEVGGYCSVNLFSDEGKFPSGREQMGINYVF